MRILWRRRHGCLTTTYAMMRGIDDVAVVAHKGLLNTEAHAASMARSVAELRKMRLPCAIVDYRRVVPASFAPPRHADPATRKSEILAMVVSDGDQRRFAEFAKTICEDGALCGIFTDYESASSWALARRDAIRRAAAWEASWAAAA